jgi:hypothetical protein
VNLVVDSAKQFRGRGGLRCRGHNRSRTTPQVIKAAASDLRYSSSRHATQERFLGRRFDRFLPARQAFRVLQHVFPIYVFQLGAIKVRRRCLRSGRV